MVGEQEDVQALGQRAMGLQRRVRPRDGDQREVRVAQRPGGGARRARRLGREAVAGGGGGAELALRAVEHGLRGVRRGVDGDHDVGRAGVAAHAERVERLAVRRRAHRDLGAVDARLRAGVLRDRHQPHAVGVAVADDADAPGHATTARRPRPTALRRRARSTSRPHPPRRRRAGRRTDHRAAAGLPDELARRLHLGSHAAGREVAVGQARRASDTVRRASSRSQRVPKSSATRRTPGQQHQDVGADVGGEPRGAAVLVDHAGDAHDLRTVLGDRDAAAAARDHRGAR